MKGARRLFKALFGWFWVLLILFSITMQSFAGVSGKGGHKVPTIQWTRQFGTSAFDEVLGVSVHASGVYVAGRTDGALPGQTHAEGFLNSDAFVRKYDFNGNEVWTRQFGTTAIDEALGVSVDASGVYVTGHTHGALPGQTSAGRLDAFVRKYDLNGKEVWTRQFGTSARDEAHGVSVHASGVYVAGRTFGALPGQTSAGGSEPGGRDTFVRKYNLDGKEVWTRQFGASAFNLHATDAYGVSVNASGVYVVGGTLGALSGQTNEGGFDTFVRKYNLDGKEVWTRQFGTSARDEARGVSVDASGVYVAGHTGGTLPGQTSTGELDAFVRKYDFDGNEVWTRQFGTSAHDEAHEVSVDASGVYVAGHTGGTLPGQTSTGELDAFVRKYDFDGKEVWTHQFGTSAHDEAYGVSVDASGMYVAGRTRGGLPGQTSAGHADAFVVKISDAPPNTSSYHQHQVKQPPQ